MKSFGWLIASVIAATSPAAAADHVVQGRSFVVSDTGSGRRSLGLRAWNFSADEAMLGNPAQDGAVLEVIANGGEPSAQAFFLPPGLALPNGPGWRGLGVPFDGWLYRDPGGVNGPVRRAFIRRTRTGLFRISATVVGEAAPGVLHVDVAPPAPGTDGGIRLSINAGDTWCAALGGEAGGAVRNMPRKRRSSRWFGVIATRNAPTFDAGCPKCAEELFPDVRDNPPAPSPEAIVVERLPLPPPPPAGAGLCTAAVNPTGCIVGIGQSGGFIDARSVVTNVTFAGAPAAPDPQSIYAGGQLIVVRTDGTTFSNGTPWKCLTCGIPATNRQGANGSSDYPQPFRDGKRILWGSNVIDCSPHRLLDDSCTPESTHVYPIVWDTGSTTGFVQRFRELRINPDDTHLGWNTIAATAAGTIDEFGLLGRLVFNEAPTSGTPLVPRYDLADVSFLLNTTDPQLTGRMISIDPQRPDQLRFDPPAGVIGEFRGFTSDGRSALGIGTQDACNWDPFATDLRTGASRRLGRDPSYMDPMHSSPDDAWTVVEDGRVDDRMAFLGGLPGVPPVLDLAGCALQGIYNNGNRRFFEPYLLDRYGDRGSYHGQALNGGGDPTPGSNSVSDPLWNARADPRWSPDGTSVVYLQAQVTAPACGGPNPIVCPTSNEPGGRTTRLMIARLTSRKPLTPRRIDPIPDDVPWGIPYSPGDPLPIRPHIPGGTYTLPGHVHGFATVSIEEGATRIDAISATYTDYSNDGVHVINGSESRTAAGVYHEALTLSGCRSGSKTTSEPGGWVFAGATRTGTLTTVIDGTTYTSPPSNQ